MIQNILLEFISDISGLKPGEQAIENLITKEKELSSTFDKGVSQNNSSLKTFVENLKNAEKASAGAFGSKGLDEFTKAVNGSNNEIKILDATIKFAKKNIDQFKPDSKEFKNLNQEIAKGEALLKGLNTIASVSNKEFKSFRTELLAVRNALQEMEDAGLQSTDTFEQLAITAGNLQDQIGDTQNRIRSLSSDTKNLDTVVQGVTGIAGAFQFAAGASALFGNENDQLQQTLVKLNALMAITQGLQQAQNFLRGQSILRLRAEAAANAVLSVSTKATAATYSALGIAVETSSVAFKALRAAIITTGVGALIVGIGLLIEKIIEWTDSTDTAKDAQDRLQRSIDHVNDSLEKQQRDLERNEKVALARAKSEGKSEEELFKLRKSYAEQTKTLLGNALRDKYATLQKARENDKISEEDYKSALKDYLDTYSKYNDQQADIDVGNYDEKARLRDKRIEDDKKAAEKSKQLAEKHAADLKKVEEDKQRYENLKREFNAKNRLSDEQEDKRQREEVVNGQKEELRTDDVFFNAKIIAKKQQMAKEDEQRKEDEAKEKVHRQQVNQIIGEGVAAAQSILQAMSSANSAAYQQEMDDVQNLKDRKIITAEEADKRMRDIRKRQLKEEKEIALFNATINMYLGISKAVAEAKPWPFNLLAIGFATIQGLAQIAAISKRQMPGLFRGTKNAKEGIYRTGEIGPELMYHKKTGYTMLGLKGEEITYVPEGAKVFTNTETAAMLHENPTIVSDMPTANPLPKWAERQHSFAGGIDYGLFADKLATAIVKKQGSMQDIPGVDVDINENGISVIAKKGIDRIQYLNKKFSIK